MAGVYGVTYEDISQAGELTGEPGEHIPYPFGADGTWPPAGFVLGADTSMVTGPLVSSTLPGNLDLEWVQGDTRKLSLLIPDVNWCTVDPVVEDEPAWEPRVFAAQVRNPYIFAARQADAWVPAQGFQYGWWRQHSMVAEFEASTVLIQGVDDDGTGLEVGQWATKVNLVIPAWMSQYLLPGSWYRWDMQSRTASTTDPAPDDFISEVITHLRGRVRVLTEWTIA